MEWPFASSQLTVARSRKESSSMLAKTNALGLKLTNHQLSIPQKLYLPFHRIRRCFRLRDVRTATNTGRE